MGKKKRMKDKWNRGSLKHTCRKSCILMKNKLQNNAGIFIFSTEYVNL